MPQMRFSAPDVSMARSDVNAALRPQFNAPPKRPQMNFARPVASRWNAPASNNRPSFIGSRFETGRSF